jgi:GNAT superfamily N-acetyltransferase
MGALTGFDLMNDCGKSPCLLQIRVRPLRTTEICVAVETHRSAFPDFFLSFLGPSFLSLLYRFYIQGDTEVALAAECSGQVVGTVIGTCDPRGFYKRLAVRHLLAFAWASLVPLLSQPSLSFRLVRALLYRGDAPAGMEGGALLASVCVNPHFKRQGIGRKLVHAFEAEVWDRGAGFIYLLTDREDNLPAQAFYEKVGWTIESEFMTPQARAMRRYWKRRRHLT